MRRSWVVDEIDGRTQHAQRWGESVDRVIGIDLRRAGYFYLEHRQHTMSIHVQWDDPAYWRLESVFHDEGGRRCAVPNSELFTVDGDDLRFRFPTDAELAAFLETRCPRLDLASFCEI